MKFYEMSHVDASQQKKIQLKNKKEYMFLLFLAKNN